MPNYFGGNPQDPCREGLWLVEIGKFCWENCQLLRFLKFLKLKTHALSGQVWTRYLYFSRVPQSKSEENRSWGVRVMNRIRVSIRKTFAQFLQNEIFLSLRISFGRKNNNLRNHSQKSFRAKLPYSVFAKLQFCAILQLEFYAIPQFRKNQMFGDGVCFLEFNSSSAERFCAKIRNKLSSKSLDNFSFGHVYFLKVDSSGIGYFLALFWD